MTDPEVPFPHEDVPPAIPLVYDRRTLQPIDPGRVGELFDELFEHRLVAFTSVVQPSGTRTVVSTIFLGLDHAIAGELDVGPILFETAVFDSTGLVWRARSRTEIDARRAHAHALDDLLATLEREGDELPAFLLPRNPPADTGEPETSLEELHPAPESPAPAVPTEGTP